MQTEEQEHVDDDLAWSPTIRLQDTGRFLQVIEKLGITLAISRRPSGVALLGVTNGEPTLSACLLPRSMGMAVDRDRLAIATMRELVVFGNVRSIAKDYPRRPDFYDAVYVPRQTFHTGYCDLHDMAFDERVVVAVNTRFSCISVIDGFFNFTPIWQPPFIKQLSGDDRCHLNGMAFHNRLIRFVTALGTTNTPYGWRDGMAENGVLMEVPSGRVVASGLSMPHSPRVIDNKLYVLEGGRGLVLQIEPTTGERRVVAKLPGFTHGLAAHGGVLFVGLSKLREKRGPQGLPIETEGDLVAGVAAVNAQNGEILGIMHFHTGVREVFDVQVIPNVRRAEILAFEQWAETPSINTMDAGQWDMGAVEEEAGDGDGQ
ncbi:TIGR03032 family protein [Pararobbsia alpina]|uniref:TIGR03032 family protein n=1 Tax=Pararobbsia alpina TaxID=621374 RepID=UPI0039A60BA3